MANLATRAGVEGATPTIHTPLIKRWTKAEIIRRGALGVDYALTTSCYDPTPEGLACGHCDSCLLRARSFRDAGVPDPTVTRRPDCWPDEVEGGERGTGVRSRWPTPATPC
jgi:7-cyano-7-deazaguanine synthase